MTDNSDARGNEQPRPSPTEPYVEESALDPAGHHTPADEEALSEQVQADEEDIERTGYETAERESEAGQPPNARANDAPGAAAEGDASARADADINRRLTEDDDVAAASEADDDLDA